MMSIFIWSLLPIFIIFTVYYCRHQALETILPLQIKSWKYYGGSYTTIILEHKTLKALPKYSTGAKLTIETENREGIIHTAFPLISGNKFYYEILVNYLCENASLSFLDSLDKGIQLKAITTTGSLFKSYHAKKQHYIFIAEADGIIPFIPMIHHALKNNASILMFHSVDYSDQLIKADELQALSNTAINFRYFPVVTQESPSFIEPYSPDLPHIYFGRINKEYFQYYDISKRDAEIYLCGSESFINTQKNHLDALGFTGEIFSEQAPTIDREILINMNPVSSPEFYQ